MEQLGHLSHDVRTYVIDRAQLMYGTKFTSTLHHRGGSVILSWTPAVPPHMHDFTDSSSVSILSSPVFSDAVDRSPPFPHLFIWSANIFGLGQGRCVMTYEGGKENEKEGEGGGGGRDTQSPNLVHQPPVRLCDRGACGTSMQRSMRSNYDSLECVCQAASVLASCQFQSASVSLT